MPTAGQVPGGDVLKAGSFVAAADLSSAQYKFVVISGAGQVNVAGAGARAIGVLQNKPTAGLAAEIITEGESLLVVDGTTAIAAGDMLKSDASGRGVKTTTATDIVCAMALEASSAANDIIRVRVFSPRPYG